MDPNPQSARPKSFFRGTSGLIVAVAVVIVSLALSPAYRWFFLISVGIGLVVAIILFLWHKFRPMREEDVDDKHPLGLG